MSLNMHGYPTAEQEEDYGNFLIWNEAAGHATNVEDDHLLGYPSPISVHSTGTDFYSTAPNSATTATFSPVTLASSPMHHTEFNVANGLLDYRIVPSNDKMPSISIPPTDIKQLTLQSDLLKENDHRSKEKKIPGKRKSWGQILPEPTTNLPPRKRAKTADEREQRRIERVLRNRAAAHASRERKRAEVDALENDKSTLLNAKISLEQENVRLKAYIAELEKDKLESLSGVGELVNAAEIMKSWIQRHWQTCLIRPDGVEGNKNPQELGFCMDAFM